MNEEARTYLLVPSMRRCDANSVVVTASDLRRRRAIKGRNERFPVRDASVWVGSRRKGQWGGSCAGWIESRRPFVGKVCVLQIGRIKLCE